MESSFERWLPEGAQMQLYDVLDVRFAAGLQIRMGTKEHTLLLWIFCRRTSQPSLFREVATMIRELAGSVRCSHESYPYGAPGFPEPHFDLEFSLKLPWILEEE
ncbi:MAG: hypothetical protein E7449_04905 [Ruminococcaceae bacterium]|nr:hypothetical protein [Oscillospiraceae bacterium]